MWTWNGWQRRMRSFHYLNISFSSPKSPLVCSMAEAFEYINCKALYYGLKTLNQWDIHLYCDNSTVILWNDFIITFFSLCTTQNDGPKKQHRMNLPQNQTGQRNLNKLCIQTGGEKVNINLTYSETCSNLFLLCIYFVLLHSL